jgi:hypothetical protein
MFATIKVTEQQMASPDFRRAVHGKNFKRGARTGTVRTVAGGIELHYANGAVQTAKPADFLAIAVDLDASALAQHTDAGSEPPTVTLSAAEQRAEHARIAEDLEATHGRDVALTYLANLNYDFARDELLQRAAGRQAAADAVAAERQKATRIAALREIGAIVSGRSKADARTSMVPPGQEKRAEYLRKVGAAVSGKQPKRAAGGVL